MPVEIPAFLAILGRFCLPHLVFSILLAAKRRRLAAKINVVGSVKKLILSFLTLPFVLLIQASSLQSDVIAYPLMLT